MGGAGRCGLWRVNHKHQEQWTGQHLQSSFNGTFSTPYYGLIQPVKKIVSQKNRP